MWDSENISNFEELIKIFAENDLLYIPWPNFEQVRMNNP